MAPARLAGRPLSPDADPVLTGPGLPAYQTELVRHVCAGMALRERQTMGVVQGAYGIIGREADEAYEAVEKLRIGPIAMAKDHEWDAFVDNNEHFVDPKLPVRRVQNITYPGKDDPAASEVKAGMLERKSKYLKSYTPGW